MFFVSTLFFLYEFVIRVIPGIISDDLMLTFQIDAGSLGFMSSIFFFVYAFLQIPVGILFDKYSTKFLLFVACLLCSLGTIIFANTTDYTLGVLGRLLTGIGASFGFVGVLKIAEEWLPRKRFALLSGLLLSLGFIGAMISGNLLKEFIDHFGWVRVLTILGYLGFGICVLIFFVIKDPEKNPLPKKALTQDLFKNIIVVMKNRSIWINGMIGFCVYAPTSVFAELWGKSYLMTVLHYSSDQAVFAVTLIFLGWAIGCPLIGMVSDVSRNRRSLMFFGSLIAAFVMIIILYVNSINSFIVFGLLFAFGFFSSTQVLNFPYAREINENTFTATAISLTNMMVVLGPALSQPLVGFLLDHYWTGVFENGIRLYSKDAYQSAFIVIPVLLFFAAILTLFLKKTPYETRTVKNIQLHSSPEYFRVESQKSS